MTKFRSSLNVFLNVWDSAASRSLSPGVALGEGRFRVTCALSAMRFCKPGTTLITDDYVGRERGYETIASHVPIS